MVATERCLELELELGRHHDVVGELTGLVTAYPLRERLVGQLMLALHRGGRRADALDTYRRLREVSSPSRAASLATNCRGCISRS